MRNTICGDIEFNIRNYTEKLRFASICSMVRPLVITLIEKNMTKLHSARILRAGSVLVDFDYEDVCDSINSENFTAPQNESIQSVDFHLKPTGGNQIIDENNIHNMNLKSITINDDEFVRNYKQVFATNPDEIRILSKHIKLTKICSNVEVNDGGVVFHIK